MIKLKNKKGEMTSVQLIGLIVFVVSLGIILLFLAMYDWGTKKEVCQDSVVMRSTFNVGPLEGKKYIPLKCSTEKICLTDGGKTLNCDLQFGPEAKDNPVTKIKVKTKKDVLDAFANAYYDCHWMLGEGKLDFMPHTKWQENYCLICSRIVFDLDSETEAEIKDISYGSLYQYLQEKETPAGKSYLSYIYPGWGDWTKSIDLFKKLQEEGVGTNDEFKKLTFDEWKIKVNNEKGYAVIAQMSPRGTWGDWIGSVSIFVGGTVLLASGVGAPLGASLMAGAIGGGVVFWYGYPGGEYTYAAPTAFPYDLNTLQGLQCSSFETAP